jgi:hypothetical protein
MTQFRGIDPISDDNWLMTKVKQNPEAFLGMAAGCALLLRAGSRSRGITHDPNGSWNDQSRCEDMRDRTKATARSVAADLQDRVKGTAAVVSEKASDYAASLADNARHRTAGRGGRGLPWTDLALTGEAFCQKAIDPMIAVEADRDICRR